MRSERTTSLFGPDVMIVLTPWDGPIEREILPAALAVDRLREISETGSHYSARILADDVDMRDWGG
jgi:hypothetical protein